MGGVVSGLVVIGGGGHARVLIAVLHKLSWDVAGYTAPRDCGAVLGVPYLGDDPVLLDVLRDRPGCAAAIGVGKVDASPLRSALVRHAGSLGFALPVIVSPDAVINEGVTLGPASMVFDGVVVNSGTHAGDACILNTNCTVEHDCRLGDNVHVAPGATVCGDVNIGSDSLIGAGATVIQGVSICAGCLVGAGAVIDRDLTRAGTYVGVPARLAP